MKEVAVLAVDAGGTWCRAALCSREGQMLGFAQGGSCNFHSIGIEKATSTLAMVLSSLINKQTLQVSCAVFALAGLDTKRDRNVLTSIVHNALSAAHITANRIYLDNDAMLTLKGSVGLNNGVIIAAGTGSIACGIAQGGQEVRVGGWGYRAGDEGSGYSIGKAAVTHILRAYDGRERPSGISTAVLSKMSFVDEDELVNWVYSPEYSVQQIAALASVIVRLAEEGDQQAMKIIKNVGQELEEMVLTAVGKLGLFDVPFKLVMSGGILQNPIILQQFIELIKDKCPGAQLAVCKEQPICAIAKYGFMLMGIHNEEILIRLSKQIDNQSMNAQIISILK